MELVVSPLLYLVQVLLDLFILFVSCIDGFLQELHLCLELAVDGLLVVLHPRLHELDLVLICVLVVEKPRHGFYSVAVQSCCS